MERAAVESPPVVDATELSPGRSSSTPRHLRYRQPGGESRKGTRKEVKDDF